MIKADKKTLARIKRVYSISKQIWPHNLGDSYQVQGAKNLIREYSEKGKYDPKKLDGLEKFFNKRLEYKKVEEEKLKKLPKGDTLILVDKHGKKWTVETLKDFINACYKKKEFDEVFEYYF
jgi:23S rRNA pseudoU1915 N3-methylase RlmH